MRIGLSDAARERLRQAALANQPWLHSTGPKTPEGKARASANGRSRQVGPTSIRELKAELAATYGLAAAMRAVRAEVSGR